MRKALVHAALVFCASAQAALPVCPPPEPGEATTDRGEWSVLPDLNTARVAYESLYEGGRRLEKRAYWDAPRGAYVFPADPPVVIPSLFLETLSAQLAAARARGYADFLFYPDLGHVHLLLPDAEADAVAARADSSARLEATLGSPGLKLLYHTGELLRLREGPALDGPLAGDEWWHWRYYSRNLLGSLARGDALDVLFARDRRYNTVRELPGHRQWGTLYFSASVRGCFRAGGVAFDLSAR